MKKNYKVENFVIFPRKIPSDFRNGEISKGEWEVLSWLRQNGNPYGITITSLSNINEDLFNNKKSDNYINKLLLGLKNKRCLYYKKRSGRRGSFEVHFGEWVLPDKSLKTLDKYFNNENSRGVDNKEEIGKVDSSQSFDVESQNLNNIKDLKQRLSSDFSINKFRGSYNDNEKDNYNDNSRGKEIKLSSFTPKTLEEEICQEIALKLEEKNINFILSVKNKYGIDFLKEVWEVYEEEVGGIDNIKSKGAFFNSIVERLTVNTAD